MVSAHARRNPLLPQLPSTHSLAHPEFYAQADALAEVLGVDLSEGGPLLAALRSSDKVAVHPDGTLQYKVHSQR